MGYPKIYLESVDLDPVNREPAPVLINLPTADL